MNHNLSFETGRRNTENNLGGLFSGQRRKINKMLSNTSRGGVQTGYFNTAFNTNPIQYAILNGRGKLYGLSLGRNLNNGETRYINILTTKQGLGAKLMSKIKNNARRNGKHYIKLSSVPGAAGFYRRQGFKNNTTVSVNGLVPMIYSFTPFLIRVKPKVKPLVRRSTRTRRVPRRLQNR